MSKVQWSPAQKAHRQFWRECVAYAKLATRDPDLRPFYVDMAVSDYHNGNDLLWKKLYGDREKPADWRW